MPNRCVVWGCDSTPNPREGIFLFGIPYFGDERLEPKRRRRMWVKFVDTKRKNFVPTKGSSICSKHFKPDDFTIRYVLLPGHDKPMIPRLKRDNLGVCVYPTIQSTLAGHDELTSSARKRRKIIKAAIEDLNTREESSATVPATVTAAVTATVTTGVPAESIASSPTSQEDGDRDAANCGDFFCDIVESTEATPEAVPLQNARVLTKKTKKTCSSCRTFRKQRESWKQRWKQLKTRLVEKNDELHAADQRVLELEKEIEALKKEREYEKSPAVPPSTRNNDDDPLEEFEDDDELFYDSDDDSTYITETESEEDEPFNEYDSTSPSEICDMKGTDLRTEPKHIVFLSQLLHLFKFCHSCKADSPLVEVRQVGTEVIVSTWCKNPGCQSKETTWHSQPTMKYASGQRAPAGNFLLSMAILFAGGSATKVFKIFDHMGLGCISLRTFFKHQRNHLFPLVHLHWKKYQEDLIEKMKDKDDITVAGDARHDSMGHNAKYGAYTILNCTEPQIIHFSLVQRNQAESSNAMEFLGFKNCMEFLLETCSLPITIFVSDRHTSIASHMNKVLTQITHYYDLWHLKKKIRKVLIKLAKEKSCESIKDWIKPCENHLYWSAMSTKSGDGNLIWAKFKSFLSHIVNQHSELDEPLFNKCAHREIRNRKWLEKGSAAHDKMVMVLTKPSLVKGIKQASPLDQTSSLEGFHSVVNYFMPKMTAYSYVGMYCRHILAILHFNSNLDREVKYRSDGSEQLRISYPKFKNGEATVRNICVTQNFDYVKELYETFKTTSKEQFQVARVELKEMTPLPMNSALEKQPVAEAVQKRVERRSMVVEDIPATASALRSEEQPTVPARQQPKCRLCGHAMKGHRNVRDCPKNQGVR